MEFFLIWDGKEGQVLRFWGVWERAGEGEVVADTEGWGESANETEALWEEETDSEGSREEGRRGRLKIGKILTTHSEVDKQPNKKWAKTRYIEWPAQKKIFNINNYKICKLKLHEIPL